MIRIPTSEAKKLETSELQVAVVQWRSGAVVVVVVWELIMQMYFRRRALGLLALEGVVLKP